MAITWDDIEDLGSSVVDGITDFADLALAVDSIFSAGDADDMAKSAIANQDIYIASILANSDRLNGIYNEGAQVTADTIANALAAYGDFGSTLPDRFNDIYDFVATNRSDEEAANLERISSYYDTLTSDLASINATNDTAFYNADAVGRSLAPSTMDFAPLANMLSGQFANARSENTSREIAQAYGKALANLPPGMENSTMRVQMERSLADLAAQRRNEDMLASIDDAFKYISGLQTAGANQQNMVNTEREIQNSLLRDTFAQSSSELTDAMKTRLFGIDYESALQGLQNDTALNDYLNALSVTGKENNLVNTGINQSINLAQAPYNYSGSGVQNANTVASSAGSSISDNTQTATNIAESAAEGLGTAIDRIRKVYGNG